MSFNIENRIVLPVRSGDSGETFSNKGFTVYNLLSLSDGSSIGDSVTRKSRAYYIYNYGDEGRQNNTIIIQGIPVYNFPIVSSSSTYARDDDVKCYTINDYPIQPNVSKPHYQFPAETVNDMITYKSIRFDVPIIVPGITGRYTEFSLLKAIYMWKDTLGNTIISKVSDGYDRNGNLTVQDAITDIFSTGWTRSADDFHNIADDTYLSDFSNIQAIKFTLYYHGQKQICTKSELEKIKASEFYYSIGQYYSAFKDMIADWLLITIPGGAPGDVWSTIGGFCIRIFAIDNLGKVYAYDISVAEHLIMSFKNENEYHLALAGATRTNQLRDEVSNPYYGEWDIQTLSKIRKWQSIINNRKNLIH